jgi:hypothetical protein
VEIKRELAPKARHRDVDEEDAEEDATYALREPACAYKGNFGAKNSVLSAEDTILWAQNPFNT